MALPTRLRFKSRSEVVRRIRHGRRFLTILGRTIVSPAAHGHGRILFSLPLAVSKKSSERHRLKRHLDEWARHQTSDLLGHHDVIVFINPSLKGLPRRALWHTADKMLEQLSRRL
ncbi:MAG: ribonuclease P protein component [Patescibacteria group bacterium]